MGGCIDVDIGRLWWVCWSYGCMLGVCGYVWYVDDVFVSLWVGRCVFMCLWVMWVWMCLFVFGWCGYVVVWVC